MTFVVGLNCHDGLVMCADSLETDGVNKRNVSKIVSREADGWGLSYACAGTSPAITRFEDMARDVLWVGEYDRSATTVKIENIVRHIRSSYPEEEIELICQMWNSANLETRLFKLSRLSSCLTIESKFACVGMDVSLPTAVLSATFHSSMNIEEGLRAGVFSVVLAGKHIEGVGGPTRAIVYRLGDREWTECEPSHISQLEARYSLAGFNEVIDKYWKQSNPDVTGLLNGFPDFQEP